MFSHAPLLEQSYHKEFFSFAGYGFSYGANTKPTNKMAGEGFFLIDVDIDSSDVGHYITYIFHCSFATATATMTSGKGDVVDYSIWNKRSTTR